MTPRVARITALEQQMHQPLPAGVTLDWHDSPDLALDTRRNAQPRGLRGSGGERRRNTSPPEMCSSWC
jgi:hypothetical protein